jgi:uncharacterized protein (TIGR00369 family)
MSDDAISRRAALLTEFFSHAPMKRTFGMTLTFDAAGDATFHMAGDPAMHHSFGDTHGGVIATLLDNAGWFTAATRYDFWVNTSELTVRLHEPARQEDLIGKGTIVRTGSRLCVASMTVHSASGRLVATGAGSFMVSSKRIALPSQK